MTGWPHSCSGFFADTEAFLMKNAKIKLCLQASPEDESLLLEDCNPASDFQDWSWQGDSLMNHGTQSCLSVVEASIVQSPCDSTAYTGWDCSNSLLSPLGSSQSYLVASRKGVGLDNVRGLKAQWLQGGTERNVCEEKAGKCCPPGPGGAPALPGNVGGHGQHPGVFPALGKPTVMRSAETPQPETPSAF